MSITWDILCAIKRRKADYDEVKEAEIIKVNEIITVIDYKLGNQLILFIHLIFQLYIGI